MCHLWSEASCRAIKFASSPTVSALILERLLTTSLGLTLGFRCQLLHSFLKSVFFMEVISLCLLLNQLHLSGLHNIGLF
jgi:hypothetical protein